MRTRLNPYYDEAEPILTGHPVMRVVCQMTGAITRVDSFAIGLISGNVIVEITAAVSFATWVRASMKLESATNSIVTF